MKHMTRMWMVNPKFLCKNHLSGEHKELHQLVGHIESGKIEVLLGHAYDFQIDTSKILERHEELTKEMKRRGWNPDSPLEYDDNLDIGTTYEWINIPKLKRRCKKCKKRIEKYEINRRT